LRDEKRGREKAGTRKGVRTLFSGWVKLSWLFSSGWASPDLARPPSLRTKQLRITRVHQAVGIAPLCRWLKWDHEKTPGPLPAPAPVRARGWPAHMKTTQFSHAGVGRVACRIRISRLADMAGNAVAARYHLPPSASSNKDFGINGFEFTAGVVDFHLPVDTALGARDVLRPRPDFLLQLG